MPVTLPDVEQTAQAQAKWINAHRESFLVGGIDRVILDSPGLERGSLLAGLEEFDAERMKRVPSAARYPESAAWVKHTLEVARRFQEIGNFTNSEVAILRSLHPYLTYRGYKQAARRRHVAEKCRIAYLPESDRGQVHIKNVDDPLNYWKPEPGPLTDKYYPDRDLVIDGTGSGLHMDDEPDELFPLSPLTMVHSYCNDVPSAVEFLTRYSPFWSGANEVIRDRQKRSVAIEKCSVNFIEVFHPGPDGRSHCSGMVCRDPQSPLGKHQRAMRQRYLDAFGQPADGPDNSYWKVCDEFEAKLATFLKSMGPKPRFDDLVGIFLKPWPQGFNKTALKAHPKANVPEYTLLTLAKLIDERRTLRWQRSEDGKTFAAEPEMHQAA